MKKPLYRVGDIIMIKKGSELFSELMWTSEYYPYAKVYSVVEYCRIGFSTKENKNVETTLGYEYQIGSVDKFNYEYWGTLRFVDYYLYDEVFHHISDKIQDHFYSTKELRKMKLDKLCQNT